MSTKINPPEGALLIIKILQQNGYEASLVGGCVRDSLLGIEPNDWDITTNCLPEKVIEIFKDYKVIPTGLKHGTVTVVVGEEQYEITTYRTDGTYSDGRHPDSVNFTLHLVEDLSRRDFTINSMSYDPLNDILFDPFHGYEDLFKGIIRAVGISKDRINEDHLRMLRAVRYRTRFSSSLTADLFATIRENSALINSVSQERIFQELYKMASESGSKFADSIQLLKELGLLKQILPEIDCMDQFPHTPSTHPEGCVWLHTLAALKCYGGNGPIVNLSILFHDVGKPLAYTNTDKIRYLVHHELGLDVLDKISERLRISNELRDTLKFICKWHMIFHKLLEVSDYKLTKLILDKNWEILYKASICDDASRGAELFDKEYWEEVDLKIERLKKLAAEKSKFDKIKSAISGEVVMYLRNIGPGKEVGRIIEKTLEHIINEGLDIENDKEKIQEFILCI